LIDQRVHSNPEGFGLILGVLNIAIWAVAMVPQLLENYRNKQVVALSPWYLLLWYASTGIGMIYVAPASYRVSHTLALCMPHVH